MQKRGLADRSLYVETCKAGELTKELQEDEDGDPVQMRSFGYKREE